MIHLYFYVLVATSKTYNLIFQQLVSFSEFSNDITTRDRERQNTRMKICL